MTLLLCPFQLFEYERVVTILLECVLDSDDENFVQRIAVFLLNSMASRVDKCQKLFLGDIGTITVSTLLPQLLPCTCILLCLVLCSGGG